MAAMLFNSDRHEPLVPDAWDEAIARRKIEQIVDDADARFSPELLWPTHPNDSSECAPSYMLYWGACGVLWALRYLEVRGACRLKRDYAPYVKSLLEPNRKQMGHEAGKPFGSYLMGDTGIQLLQQWHAPSSETCSELIKLVEATRDHPARELMWGAPGTLLASLFLHQQTGDAVWSELYRTTAQQLWSQLHWSVEHGCHYWTQDLYGKTYTFLDAIHGFVATAAVLINGRHLLTPAAWSEWQECIANTVRQTVECDRGRANWRARLDGSPLSESPGLVQFCHGAPGFVICLADFPSDSLDDLLVAGGETTWSAGPLRKGSNLCHGTGGNGYAFLKLYRRFGGSMWLERARAFAMHGIHQTERDLAQFGQLRYSLWTGDLGFAVYLLDCIEGTDRFPTLDVFFES
ncbi:LanC-like protein [Variovorax sp. J22P240]|uniref:lanthionine synthetase C family protein n=1 Tax=unclassified Variovorax TaxID=663243 RepID=UPI002574B947|nr:MULTISPECIES: LanC-like protein [unclassified Variovorax]MDL9998061.1 LanC-like protein [Variovorax sp. J22P240]MDM0053495.1 LanC-like protein [Variovorax sp. J22R115]